jgi:hypothetical protein
VHRQSGDGKILLSGAREKGRDIAAGLRGSALRLRCGEAREQADQSGGRKQEHGEEQEADEQQAVLREER